MSRTDFRVAILMPVRNAAPTLERALVGIAAQTHADWELWAVDDGSDDATPEILRAWARRDPRVRLLQQPRLGIVAALNAAIAATSAPLLARMDADDEMAPGRLAAQAAALAAHPDWDLVGCLVRFGGDHRAGHGYALHVEWGNSVLTPESIALRRFVESPFAHPSVLFRRSAVERWGDYREGPFPEDYELWLRWLDAGAHMGKVGEELLLWNDPPGRLSRTDPRYSMEAFYRLKADYLARELSRLPPPERRLWVWGAGRLTRRRVDLLKAKGVRVDGYIDIDPRKAAHPAADGAPVILPEDIPPPGERFILGYVASRGARELLLDALQRRGYAEGRDFLLCA